MTGSLSGLSCSSSSSFSPAATSGSQPEDLNPPKRQRVTTAESSSQTRPAPLGTASYFVYAIETQIHRSEEYSQSTETLLKHSFKLGFGKEVIKSLTKTFAVGTRYFPKDEAVVQLLKDARESYSSNETNKPQSEEPNALKPQKVITNESSSETLPTQLVTAAYFIYMIETQIHRAAGYNNITEALLKHSFKHGFGTQVIKSLTKTFAVKTRYFPQSPLIVARFLKVASESGVEIEALSNHYRSNGFGTIKAGLLKFKNVTKETRAGDPTPFCKLLPSNSRSPVEALVKVLGFDRTLTSLTLDCYTWYDETRRHQVTARELPSVLTAINEHPTLTNVSFAGCCFEDRCAAVFSAFIPLMELTELYFNTTGDMTLDGVTQIMTSMASNSTITSLKFTNYCDNHVLDAEEYKRAIAGLKTAMEGFLKNNTTVVSLHMEEDTMSRIGGIMADLLPLTATLTTLKLPSSSIQEGVIFRLFQVVQGGSLTVLDLSGNDFSNKCFEEAGRLLAYNTSLTGLYLREMYYFDDEEAILPESANSIAQGLSYNTTLKVADLSCIKMPPDSKIELAETLRLSNFTLKSLFMDEKNKPVEQVFTAFRKALARNSVLSTISLGYLQIGADGYFPTRADPHSQFEHDPELVSFQELNRRNDERSTATLFGMLLPRLFEKE